MLLQCIGGQPWTTWHWRPEEGSRDRNLHLVCDAVRPLNAQHWPGGKLANQWLEMKQCGEWGGGRWLRLYPANKKGASASTILTVEETRTSRTDGVRNMVRCISQTPLSPPRANYTRKCFARERKGQTPTTVNLPPPPPFNHDTNSSYASNEWNRSSLPLNHFEDDPCFSSWQSLRCVRDTQPNALIKPEEVKMERIHRKQHLEPNKIRMEEQ